MLCYQIKTHGDTLKTDCFIQCKMYLKYTKWVDMEIMLVWKLTDDNSEKKHPVVYFWSFTNLHYFNLNPR